MTGTSDQSYWLANTRQLLLLVTCKVYPMQRIMHQSCWCLSWLVATNSRSNSWLQIPYSALLTRPTLFLRKLMQGLSHGSLGGKLRLSKPLPGAPSLSAKSAKSGMCQCTDAVCLDMRQPNEHAGWRGIRPNWQVQLGRHSLPWCKGMTGCLNLKHPTGFHRLSKQHP